MRRARRIVRHGLRLCYRANGREHARLGLAVSRRYGNAVQRNRLKRCLRSAFRQHPVRTYGLDLLLIPQAEAAVLSRSAFRAANALFDLVVQRVAL
ncbi:MAG: ribonuclease P protein component [Zetaproteobacteria bacterium]|nr:MAG: ribonuclease P protein component [Zetaproteobacteria bacterium]